MPDQTPPDDKPPTPKQVVASVLASFFGVQSSRNRRRDFTHGKAPHFIAVAFALTLALGLFLAGAAKLAIWLARG